MPSFPRKPLVSGIPHGSCECQASLRAGRSQGGRFGWRGCVLTEAEGAEPAEFEAREQQRGAVLERAGGGLMQDAQQQESDQRDIDLDAHGVFAAAEKAADLEVLFQPFEQQLDLPALFVELAMAVLSTGYPPLASPRSGLERSDFVHWH